MKIFYEEIHQMASNGVVLTCAGMMDGQLIIFTEPQGNSSTIMFVAMASNPESSVERVYNIFQNVIHDKFPNYEEYTTDTLCQKCVEIAFTPNNTLHQKFKQKYVLGTTRVMVIIYMNFYFAIFLNVSKQIH